MAPKPLVRKGILTSLSLSLYLAFLLFLLPLGVRRERETWWKRYKSISSLLFFVIWLVLPLHDSTYIHLRLLSEGIYVHFFFSRLVENCTMHIAL